MGTERPTCGLSSLLPDSCRGRAEAFARRLSSRLQSLGRTPDPEDESSWLAPKPVTTSQPRLSSSSDSDLYFDFDVEPLSPASPVEESNPRPPASRDPESGFVLSSSSHSPGSESSDGPYFDPENAEVACPSGRSCRVNLGTLPPDRCNGHIPGSGLLPQDIKNGSSSNAQLHKNESFNEDQCANSSIQTSPLRSNQNTSSDVQKNNVANGSVSEETRANSSVEPLCHQAKENNSISLISSDAQNNEAINDELQPKNCVFSTSQSCYESNTSLYNSKMQKSNNCNGCINYSLQISDSLTSSIQTNYDTNTTLNEGRCPDSFVQSKEDNTSPSYILEHGNNVSNGSLNEDVQHSSPSEAQNDVSINEENRPNNCVQYSPLRNNSNVLSSEAQTNTSISEEEISDHYIRTSFSPQRSSSFEVLKNDVTEGIVSENTTSSCSEVYKDIVPNGSLYEDQQPSNYIETEEGNTALNFEEVKARNIINDLLNCSTIQDYSNNATSSDVHSEQEEQSENTSSSQENYENVPSSADMPKEDIVSVPQQSDSLQSPEVLENVSSSEDILISQRPGEHSNQLESFTPTGSYCSSFCRASDLLIEYSVECNQQVCDLEPVTCAENVCSENIETNETLPDEEYTNEPDSSLECSKNSDSVNIKQLLKQGYLTDTGQEGSSVLSDAVVSEEVISVDCTIAIKEVEETPKEEYSCETKSKPNYRSNETDDDDDEEYTTQRLRRCTSLKSGKTPPGTPGRKKIVRFADVLGLDLADVRTFLDEVPRIPSSAYSDLRDADLSLGSSAMPVIGSNPAEPSKCLVPLFQQPGGQPDFLDRVKKRQVCLENAVVKDPVMFSVEGTVRVTNLDFHKSVHIRYSLDGWASFADLQATYVANSCDGFSDKFCFVLYAHTLIIGQRLEFAVRFQCKGCQFWDNNQGANYCFQCLPPASSTPYLPLSLSSPDDRWAAFY